ncbi:uncharacterized protein J4E84_009706 [Alternaria hordeiaustralica]|uniref:uncharacterized protein n=1 Tax=Alternaria hordeiaustralica TaxID=1187925 RepID=UPI0020C49F2F|nr:uncharacterized protein J4E84_009706 [Alternaria hordeiaustralica]KAI4676089.1 hypothetical protein J4E84_009706 [Alternaria hordeiaustralica]
MIAPRCFSVYAALLTVLATAALSATADSPFPCTGGSIYFTGHTVDGLLFQNPDLYHDLYVFKCVTTVVFTADSGGEAANNTRVQELERGLEDAYSFMSDVASVRPDGTQSISSSNEEAPLANETTVQIGKHTIVSSSLLGLSNAQILYLRLPDSTYFGEGYKAYSEESLKKLYSADISEITTTDGKATYTIDDLKDIIATILRDRRANQIRVMNYQSALSTDNDDDQLDHADRIVSAKLVMDVVEEEEIGGNVTAYACDSMRILGTNNLETPDYIKKVDAFFEYAKRDPDMCQSLDECGQRRQNIKDPSKVKYNEVDHVANFLKREYYIRIDTDA